MAAESRSDRGPIVHHAPATERWSGAGIAAAISLSILVGGQVLAAGGWIVGAIGLLPSTFLGWHLGPRARSHASVGGSLETIALMSIGVVILGDVVVSVAWSIFAVFGLGATGAAHGLEALAYAPLLFTAGICFVAWWIVFPVALAATAWLVVVRRLSSGHQHG